MTTITTIGLDLAKKVFQVHGVDVEGKVVVAPDAQTQGGVGVLSCRRVWSAWRPAAVRNIGGVRLLSSGTP